MAPPGTISLPPADSAGDVAPARPLKAARIATDITEKGAKEAALETWRCNIRGGLESFLSLPRQASWWTGPKPNECPGFCSETGTLTSLPLPNIATATREETMAYFSNTWCLTEVLFSSLQGEEPFYRPPYHNLRHPKIFYYAHPAVLYINKLRVAGVLQKGINQFFETIFETGVDEMSWDDLSKNEMEWPSVTEVTEYRRQAFAIVRDVIMNHPCMESKAQLQASPAWATYMGFEHERIHIETSSVLIRELPARLVQRPAEWPAYHPTALAWGDAKLSRRARSDGPAAAAAGAHPAPGVDFPANPLVRVEAGEVRLGKPTAFPSFGWDNEYGDREFHVRSFEAGKYLCSNGEFHEFVRDGGYAQQRFWTEDGWKWRTFRNAKWPPFWVPSGPQGLHQYRLRLVFDVVPMAWDLPVDVNLHEAAAFCAWRAERHGLPKGALRLLSELEHHRLRDRSHLLARAGGPQGAPSPQSDPVVAKSGAQLRAECNTNLAWGSQAAVDALPPTSQGFHSVFGDVWQWCEDHFAALPGFKIHQYYDDFSTPCFDGEHNVIMGGSFASSGDLSSVFARFHFRPHFHQHAGFRVVKAEHLVTSSMDAPPPHAGGWVPPSSDPAKRLAAAAAGGAHGGADALGRTLLLHYGAADEALGTLPAGPLRAALAVGLAFPANVAEMVAAAAARYGVPKGRVLDIGCAVGGTAFHLARAGFADVLGIDPSAAFIRAAEQIRSTGALPYSCRDEGDSSSSHVAKRPALPAAQGNGAAAAQEAPKGVAFKQMDASCLAPDLGTFDCVVVEGTLDKMTSPKSCLGRMGGSRGVVKPQGLLLVVCAFDWSESRTPKEAWLCSGGQSSLHGLKQALGPEFEMLESADTPQLLRDGARKFELQVCQATLWRRMGAPAQ